MRAEVVMSEYTWGDAITPLLTVLFPKPSQIPEYGMRVAPGTDAVVWKPWDTSHVECEL